MLQIILALVICLLIGFLLWFIGHAITKQLNINEENKLLNSLLNLAGGITFFLITVNLFSSISKDFNIGLAISLIPVIGILIWRFNDLKQIIVTIKKYLDEESFLSFFRKNTDKYFWILLGIINFIYGLTAVTSLKLDHYGQGNTHIFNVNQLINNIYPPKFSFLPSLDLRYHYGADILSAIISKISKIDPEISFDILTIIFLNLTLLTIYSLSAKFLNNNKTSKYLSTFIALLGWGPIVLLFNKTSLNEAIPDKFFIKLNYLTQTRLLDSANWSGLVFHWFFSPSIGLGTFFFLIAIYLAYRLLKEKEQKISFVLFLGIFISGLVIIDFSKFLILISGIVICFLSTFNVFYTNDLNKNSSENKTTIRNIVILSLTILIFGFIHGNYLKLDNSLASLTEFYKLGKSNMDNKFSPLSCNTVLMAVFIFGFYKAYKEKQSWITFLIPYFALAMIIPSFVTLSNAGSGRIFMTGNIMGAFAFPIVVDFVIDKFKFTDKKLVAFYSAIFIVFSFSTLMFFLFGDKEKPNFTYDGKDLKHTGIQKLQASTNPQKSEEIPFINSLKLRSSGNQKIIIEQQYAENVSNHTGLSTFLLPQGIPEAIIKSGFLEHIDSDYKSVLTLEKKPLVDKNVNWIYLTPKMFRSILSPQAKIKLLNAYLNNGTQSIESNKKPGEQLIELIQINPSHFPSEISKNFPDLLDKFLKSPKEDSLYIKQIAECPYYGIYSELSNDFDGDKVSDIAFYDPSNKKWYIIYGKNQEEVKFDLTSSILNNVNSSDLLIPVPSDYDGDAKTDIALFDRNDGTWHILASSAGNTINPQYWCNVLGEIPLPADVDGDGKTDSCCYNAYDHRWPSYPSTTRSYTTITFPTSPGDITVHSDVNGDKKADNLAYKPTLGIYEVRLSACEGASLPGSTCGNSITTLKVKVGGLTSRAVPADYDGDGKIDLATWTPGDGKWDIVFSKDLPSNEINPSIKTINLGSPGCIPVPGDYNGDGKSEPAVYDQSSSKFVILFENGTKKEINCSKHRTHILSNFIGI